MVIRLPLSTKVILVGDCNVHVNNPSHTDVSHFLSTLDNAGFHQHVSGLSHKHGHTPAKSCFQDPIPTCLWFMKQNVNVFVPVIKVIINRSLSSGIFPDALKNAIISKTVPQCKLVEKLQAGFEHSILVENY